MLETSFMKYMSTECHRCKNDAEYIVTKRDDLSHREVRYCEQHAKPYEQYPTDFEVKRIKN